MVSVGHYKWKKCEFHYKFILWQSAVRVNRLAHLFVAGLRLCGFGVALSAEAEVG